MSYVVHFEPTGVQGAAAEDASLLDTAWQLGVNFGRICDGKGRCGKCKVRVLAGNVSAPTNLEREKLTATEMAEGYRLACQTYPRSDLRIDVSSASVRRSQAPPSGQRETDRPIPAPDARGSSGPLGDESAPGHRHHAWSRHGHHGGHGGKRHHGHGHGNVRRPPHRRTAEEER